MKTLLQTTLLAAFMSSLFLTQSVFARTVEVDVHGMTCAFCVDSLERKFNKMETVSKVAVSLKLKKIRLETDATLPTVETIKQAVLDTGFTPVKVTILPDVATPDAASAASTMNENKITDTTTAENSTITGNTIGMSNADKKAN